MKRMLLAPAVFLVAVAAQGQGQFFFTTRDIPNGNNLIYTLNGAPVSGDDFFLQVLAGPSQNSLTPLDPLLPLNRTGSDAGYPNPFGLVFYAPAGSAVVAYRAFQGDPSRPLAGGDIYWVTQMLDSQGNIGPLQLPTDPTTPPPELYLGTRSLPLILPEPEAWVLAALGLGMVASCRRRAVLALAPLLVTASALGQGQFFFTTRDIPNGNNVTFVTPSGIVTDPAFLEVLAGPSLDLLTPLTPVLPLNLAGAGAGYPNPFGANYNAPAGSWSGVTFRLTKVAQNAAIGAVSDPLP